MRYVTATLMTLLLVLPGGEYARAQATVAPRTIVHHDLEVELFPASNRLVATDRLSLPAFAAPPRLFLASQVRVVSVTVDDRPVEFTFSQGILSPRLPAATRNQPLTLSIRYEGRFADAVPQTPINNEDPTYGVAATIGEQGTFLAGGSGWYPDPRQGNATWRIRVKAPPGYLAVTAGRLEEQMTTTDHSLSTWVEEVPLSNLTLSAGPYQVQKEDAWGIPLLTYFYAQSQDLAQTYLKAAQDYLELYQNLFGPYPFEKFAIVENFFPTGYGFPSWTLLGSSVVRLPFIVETSLGHEIAHSWWGTGVRTDFRQGNWSEGLTTYVADYLFLERRSAEDARDYRLKILRDYASLVDADRDFPLRDFLRRDSRPSQAVGYGKAAMVFHMLRRQIGEEAFWGGLRHIAETRMFEQIGWDEFAATFSRLSGQDLTPFFNQWVQRPGAPRLRFADVKAERSGNEWRVAGRIVQQGRPFTLEMPLVLKTEGDTIHTQLAVRQQDSPFELRSPSPPRRLLADPDAHVFRRLEPTEIPASVNNVRGSDNLVAVIAADLPRETATASRLLLRALRKEGIDVLREEEVRPAQLEGRDLLFFGLPRGFSGPLLETMPLTFSTAGFVFQGQTYSGPSAALFAAVTPADRPGVTWAYFIPFSPGAAEDAARRIPHYGKYSYLVFFEGANREKGIWDPQDSPLIHNFKKKD